VVKKEFTTLQCLLHRSKFHPIHRKPPLAALQANLRAGEASSGTSDSHQSASFRILKAALRSRSSDKQQRLQTKTRSASVKSSSTQPQAKQSKHCR